MRSAYQHLLAIGSGNVWKRGDDNADSVVVDRYTASDYPSVAVSPISLSKQSKPASSAGFDPLPQIAAKSPPITPCTRSACPSPKVQVHRNGFGNGLFAVALLRPVNIPPKRNRKDPICFSPDRYRARNLIERFFNNSSNVGA
jgi:hypothetical protein